MNQLTITVAVVAALSITVMGVYDLVVMPMGGWSACAIIRKWNASSHNLLAAVMGGVGLFLFCNMFWPWIDARICFVFCAVTALSVHLWLAWNVLLRVR